MLHETLVLAWLAIPQGEPFVHYRHPGSGDQLGAAVGAVGDLDGDGFDDYAIGAPGDAGVGRVDVRSGVNGTLLLRLRGSDPADAIGWRVGGVGDVDADGVPDLAYSSVTAVTVVSGATGMALHRLDPLPASRSVPAFDGVGDLDLDGADDVLVGDSESYVACLPGGAVIVVYGQGGGRAVLYSGRTGGAIRTVPGSGYSGAVGGAVARIADADGDGVSDFAVADVTYGNVTTGQCTFTGRNLDLRAYSGSSGRLLWAVPERPADLVAIDDIDGDGVGDLAVGLPFTNEVALLSGRDGRRLRSIAFGSPPNGFLGIALDVVEDMDGDGLRDLVAGEPTPAVAGPYGPIPAGPGRVCVLSTGTGAPVFPTRFYEGPTFGSGYGAAVAAIGDVDGDGSGDIVTGAPDHPEGGYAEVVSLGLRCLWSDRHEISLSAGGVQTLRLWTQLCSPALTAERFVLLGSATGSLPGFTFRGTFLPLVLDSYTSLLFNHPAVSPVSPVFGSLNAAGQGDARFTVPPGSPIALAGLTLFHAFVAFDAHGTRVSSWAVPVTLVP